MVCFRRAFPVSGIPGSVGSARGGPGASPCSLFLIGGLFDMYDDDYGWDFVFTVYCDKHDHCSDCESKFDCDDFVDSRAPGVEIF